MPKNNVRVLFLGDIVGPIGRRVVKYYLNYYKEKENIDFVIANGENATHGRGISFNHYNELINSGVDCLTSGNHFFENRDYLKDEYNFSSMIRPINFDEDCPLKGSEIFTLKDNTKIRVSNAIGRVFLNQAQYNPFYMLYNLTNEEDVIHIVDFHAEATAEKRVLSEYLDGKVSAVIGTHTHVQTNDAKLLKEGTFFLTDAGMNGEYDSVLGTIKDNSIYKTVTLMPAKFETNETGDGLLNGVILDIDKESKKVTSFKLLNEVILKEELYKNSL